MNATLELPASKPVNGRRHALALAASPPLGAAVPAPAASPPAAADCPPPDLLMQPIFLRGIPTARDREIFRQVVLCRRTKTDVARQFQLSQPRISQICGDVQRWMKKHTPRQTEELTQPQWLNLAENMCRERLETQYALAMEALEASRQPRQWAGWDQEGNRVEKLPESPPRPQSALMNIAMKATIELARLDGVWGSGDAWAGRNREKLEEFRQERDREWDAETACNEATLAELGALPAQEMSPAAPPAGLANPPAATASENPPALTYERLWNLPPAAAAGAGVAATARDASDAATDVCSDGPARNLETELIAERLKKAYAPQEPAEAPAAQPTWVPPENGEQALRRDRQRKAFLAPLARL
ncbi:MAG TPA: hypothetical protein VMP01_17655, partial [Pirellulaceae bacterium]|nr:hypothetical protein [Pirellulaceae bacterium]